MSQNLWVINCSWPFAFRPKIRIESGSSTSSRDSSSVQTDSETQFLKEETSENEFLPQRKSVTKAGFKISDSDVGDDLGALMTSFERWCSTLMWKDNRCWCNICHQHLSPTSTYPSKYWYSQHFMLESLNEVRKLVGGFWLIPFSLRIFRLQTFQLPLNSPTFPTTFSNWAKIKDRFRKPWKPIIGKITKIIAGLSLHSGKCLLSSYSNYFLMIKPMIIHHLVLTGMSIGMRDSNEHMIAGIIGIIPHKVAVLIILSTLTLEINRSSRFVHITIFSAALPVGILISIGTVLTSPQQSGVIGGRPWTVRTLKNLEKEFQSCQKVSLYAH